MKGTGRFPGSILSWILIKAGRTDGRGNRECWVISERGEIERDAGTPSLWLMLCLPVTLKTHTCVRIFLEQEHKSQWASCTHWKLKETSITVCHNKLLPVHILDALQVKYCSALKAYEDKKTWQRELKPHIMSRRNSDLKLSMLYDNASLRLCPRPYWGYCEVRKRLFYWEKNRDREVR